jgi:hypothetical protein
MERNSLRAILSIVLLVIVAWTGIALFVKLQAGGASVGLVVLWAIAALVVAGFAVWSGLQAHRARLQRESKQTRGR